MSDEAFTDEYSSQGGDVAARKRALAMRPPDEYFDANLLPPRDRGPERELETAGLYEIAQLARQLVEIALELDKKLAGMEL